MILFASSAAFVGLIHTLAPGHWLPVVLLVRARQWRGRQAALAALVAASGHIVVSLALAWASVSVGSKLFEGQHETVERYGGLGLMAFGLMYSVFSYFRHSRCHGHEHHGPVPSRKEKAPYLFLFSIGLSPCVAVFPIVAAAAGSGGSWAAGLVSMGFALGVVAALMLATLLVSRGLWLLDHPVLEHHSDVIVGITVALMGTFLFFAPHLELFHRGAGH
jgi:cytochrome c biogenesis protein CcdA